MSSSGSVFSPGCRTLGERRPGSLSPTTATTLTFTPGACLRSARASTALRTPRLSPRTLQSTPGFDLEAIYDLLEAEITLILLWREHNTAFNYKVRLKHVSFMRTLTRAHPFAALCCQESSAPSPSWPLRHCCPCPAVSRCPQRGSFAAESSALRISATLCECECWRPGIHCIELRNLGVTEIATPHKPRYRDAMRL